MPTVTIGLPFYNHTAYLNEAIQSIVGQTFTDWELVLVNDGSTDTAEEVAKGWTGDPRIRLISDQYRTGLATRLNQIADLANGKYLARMDADDRMAPDRLQKQVAYLEAHPNVDAVGSFAYVMNEQGTVYGYRGTNRLPTQKQHALAGFPVIHPTIIGKTNWFRQHPYPLQWQRLEDLARWVSVCETSTIHIIPEPLLYYREHSNLAFYELAMQEYRQFLQIYADSLPYFFYLKLYLGSYARATTFKLVHWFGQAELLRRRRSKPLGKPNRHQQLVQLFTTPLSLVFLKGQAAFWRSKGFSMQVICSDGPALTAFEKSERVRCQPAIPFTRKLTPLQDLYCLLKTYIALRRIRPTIVHVNTPKAALLGMIAAWLARVPVRVYEIHGFPFETHSGLLRWMLIQIERLICRLSTGVLAVSHSLKTVALQHHIGIHDNITVLARGSCNGIDATQTFNRERLDKTHVNQLKTSLNITEKVLGYVGRLTTDKGLYELVASWQILRAQNPELTLLVVGATDEPSAAEVALFEQLKNDCRVRLIGHVTNVASYLALMDVLVLPTYREGLGMVLLEAAAMQVPVVASAVTGAIDAVINNHTGQLCPPASPELLAKAIQRYLNYPELARRHGQNARQWVITHYQPERIWEAKWAFYCQQLQQQNIYPNHAPSAHPRLFSTT